MKETIMDAINDVHALTPRRTVSRRHALQGFGGATLAAAFAAPCWAGATSDNRLARSLFAFNASDDPADLIAAYVAAVNAEDLAGILALYADDAVHIFLPTADGSAGICRGKGEFRLWYEASVAHHDRITLVPESLAVAGNQATFLVQMSSDPWRAVGLEALQAQAQLVVIGGKIMTHVEILSPDSMRTLQAARSVADEVAIPHGIHGPW
jgi:ketosteroid isomerase-like protein